jgi:hypothetical protein
MVLIGRGWTHDAPSERRKEEEMRHTLLILLLLTNCALTPETQQRLRNAGQALSQGSSFQCDRDEQCGEGEHCREGWCV